MPESRLQCPYCKAVLKTATVLPAGKSISCPKCLAVIEVPAAGTTKAQAASRLQAASTATKQIAGKRSASDDSDLDDDELLPRRTPARQEERDDKPRKKKSIYGRNERREKKKGGKSVVLWLAVGGAAVALVVVLIIALGGNSGKDPKDLQKPPFGGGPDAKGGEQQGAYSVVKRIDTNIPLPQREPFILIRGILGLGGSADSGVIAVASALSPRKYTFDRSTGRVINEFDDPDDLPDSNMGSLRGTYHGLPPIVSPDGKLAVFMLVPQLGGRKTVKIRDVATGNIVKVLGDDKITHFEKVAFSPKGDTVFALVHDSGKHVLAGWSVANWQRVCDIKMPENREPSWLFPMADGKTVVTITGMWVKNPQVDFFDVRQQTFVRSIVLAQYKSIRNAAVTPDGKLLAVVGDDGGDKEPLGVIELDTAKQLCTVGRFDMFRLGDFRFLPSGRLAVTGPTSVTTYDPKTGTQKAIWNHDEKVDGRKITHLTFCANGDMLLVLDGNMATILVARLKE